MRNSSRELFDGFILRNFKYVVVLLAVLSIVLFFTYFSSALTFGHLIYSICVAYALGFVLLGIPAVFYRRSSLFPRWKIIAFMFVFGIVVSLLLWFLFGESRMSPNHFISGFFLLIDWSVNEISLWSVYAGVTAIMVLVTLATYGVLEVMTALLGKNFHRVLLSLMKPNDTKLKRTARNLFMVPYIVDIDEVVLRPRKSEGFDFGLFSNLYKYVFMVGVIVASYLFLNPVFLRSIPLQDMMLITCLLSLFVIVLVMPVNLTHTLGAEAHSKGNRPWILWKGLRDRFMRKGFFLALFLTLLWVCLFTGEDLARMFVSYAGYMFFMILVSLLVSFIYVNSFYPDLNTWVAEEFEDAKSKL